ncbi:MAG: cysteine protease [Roseibacillus sp.]|nr:cysteine protease [Roseibacillus sp.]
MGGRPGSRIKIMKALTLLLPIAFVALVATAKVRREDPEQASHQRTVLSRGFVTEGASIGDVNGDGKNDLVAGPYWYAGPDFKKQHRYYPGEPVSPKGYAHSSFLSWVMDVSGDGRNDILQIAHGPAFHLDIYVQPENGEEVESWPKHRVVKSFGGESPEMIDITGDERPELVGLNKGVWGFFFADWKDPTKPWGFHAISENTKAGHYTHGLGVGDLNGDKRIDIIWKEGWYECPANPMEGLWKFHKFQFSPQGGGQMLVYDVDGDGDNDIVTSLWAHGWGMAWFENTGGGEVAFRKHVIMPSDAKPGTGGVVFSQHHSLAMGDFNADGLTDFVTGKRWWAHGGGDPGADQPAVLYWFELRRSESHGVEFIPHLIDTDSGVGTQIAVGDLDGDDKTDIGIGNKKGIYLFRTR